MCIRDSNQCGLEALHCLGEGGLLSFAIRHQQLDGDVERVKIGVLVHRRFAIVGIRVFGGDGGFLGGGELLGLLRCGRPLALRLLGGIGMVDFRAFDGLCGLGSFL